MKPGAPVPKGIVTRLAGPFAAAETPAYMGIVSLPVSRLGDSCLVVFDGPKRVHHYESVINSLVIFDVEVHRKVFLTLTALAWSYRIKIDAPGVLIKAMPVELGIFRI